MCRSFKGQLCFYCVFPRCHASASWGRFGAFCVRYTKSHKLKRLAVTVKYEDRALFAWNSLFSHVESIWQIKSITVQKEDVSLHISGTQELGLYLHTKCRQCFTMLYTQKDWLTHSEWSRVFIEAWQVWRLWRGDGVSVYHETITSSYCTFTQLQQVQSALLTFSAFL